jgi:hypothetical protein
VLDGKKLGFVVLGNLSPCLFYWNFSSKVSRGTVEYSFCHVSMVTVFLVFLIEMFVVVSMMERSREWCVCICRFIVSCESV